MKHIQLTTKQQEIFNKYQQEKQDLQNKFQLVTQMENDFVTTVFESAGEKLVEGIKYDNGAFVIPEASNKEIPKQKAKK